jgi:hypothetical protein
VGVNIAKIRAQLLNNLVGERGRRCPSTARAVIFYTKARLKAFGLFFEPGTPSNFSVNQDCTLLSVKCFRRHRGLGILQQILARGGGRHLEGILIGTVSILGSMKAERALDNRNFLAHSKESGLRSRPIKKAAHDFGTGMKFELGGKAGPRRNNVFWP